MKRGEENKGAGLATSSVSGHLMGLENTVRVRTPSGSLLWSSLFFFFFELLILYWGLINNVVIDSGESEGTQPYIYMYPSPPNLLSHPGCHTTLSRVPCAIQ